MTLVEDIAATRRALAGLERLTTALVRHYGDGVDGRRLQADVGRVAVDLDLLCGAPAAAAPAPQQAPPTRHEVPDTAYTDGFWMDAEDEGLGRYDGRGR